MYKTELEAKEYRNYDTRLNLLHPSWFYVTTHETTDSVHFVIIQQLLLLEMVSRGKEVPG